MSEKKKKHLPEGYLAVYRLPFAGQVAGFVTILVYFIFLFLLYKWLEDSLIVFSVIFGGLWGIFFIAPQFLHIARGKLVIAEKGLIWWTYGVKREVAWHDLSMFDNQVQRYRSNPGRTWGIATRNWKFVPLGMYLHMPLKSTWTGKKDLEAFRKTEAGAYFYEYAPHLFDESAEEKQKTQS